MKKSGDLKLPELDKIIAEIKAGQRVIIFPPGIFLFVGIMIITMVGTGGLIAMSGPVLSPFFDAETITAAHLFSLLIFAAPLVLSGIMITRGKKHFAAVLKCLIALMSLCYTAYLILYFLSGDNAKLPYAFCLCVVAWATFYITTRPTFTLFCEFFYRLKK